MESSSSMSTSASSIVRKSENGVIGTIILAVLGEVLGEDEGVLYDATC